MSVSFSNLWKIWYDLNLISCRIKLHCAASCGGDVSCSSVAVWKDAGIRDRFSHVCYHNWKWLKLPSAQGLNTMPLRCCLTLVLHSRVTEFETEKSVWEVLSAQATEIFCSDRRGWVLAVVYACTMWLTAACSGGRSMLCSGMELAVVSETCSTGKAAQRAVQQASVLSMLPV